jgi:hypothetical protein
MRRLGVTASMVDEVWSSASTRILGVSARVAVRGGPGGLAERALDELRLRARRWHAGEPDGELALLNAGAGSTVVVADDTFRLLARLRWAWRASRGCYDPGLGSAPDTVVRTLRMDPTRRAVRLPGGVRLDPGPLAAGAAIDEAVASLRAWGARAGWVGFGPHLRRWGPAGLPPPWWAPATDAGGAVPPARSWVGSAAGPLVATGPAAWLTAVCLAAAGVAGDVRGGSGAPNDVPWRPPGVDVSHMTPAAP